MLSTGNAARRDGDDAARWWLSTAALLFVALAALMGWGASFVGLHAYGQDQMSGFSYWSAWLIPATFDGAAFGATLITYRASLYGRSAMRGRLLMWTFTAISSWINWIHQLTPEARLVAAGLPIAAVAVFDVVLAEMRADFEQRNGARRFRFRPGLLLLRCMADRSGTVEAFRTQLLSVPVPELVGTTVAGTALTGTHDDRHERTGASGPHAHAAAQLTAGYASADEGNDDTMPERSDDVTAAPEAERQTGTQPGASTRRRRPRPVVRVQRVTRTAAGLRPRGRATGTSGKSLGTTGTASEANADAERHVIGPETNRHDVPVTDDVNEKARRLVRQDPNRWTSSALGEEFGYSERWGRLRRAEVREEVERAEQRQLRLTAS
ncbi:DUF2637 domain-containing protein (plasmid) [Saccharopolyspora sp. ID03-671]|uniref:DUF2637 domain-containing protein n=1 Tax=Saccharopolyspora sp. ID03-671 TaxID=3073066 RepID=UPI0030F41FBA